MDRVAGKATIRKVEKESLFGGDVALNAVLSDHHDLIEHVVIEDLALFALRPTVTVSAYPFFPSSGVRRTALPNLFWVVAHVSSSL
jgi:hypothetical protein